jgi:hypothetical protein
MNIIKMNQTVIYMNAKNILIDGGLTLTISLILRMSSWQY